MSKLRVMAYGTAGVLAVAAGLVAMPSSRHLIRHEIARHHPFRFSSGIATPVVPVATELPLSPASDASDPRFAPHPAATVKMARLDPPRLEDSAFAPPTVTSRKPSAEIAAHLDHGAPVDSARGPTASDAVTVDQAGARQAIQSYRQHDLAAADDFARMTSGPVRAMLDWVAIRLDSREVGVPRMVAFVHSHPDWPTLPWINRRIEEQRSSVKDPQAVLALFADTSPTTLLGKLALARARIATGNLDGGAQIVRAVWRDEDLTAGEESLILKDFGSVLRKEDYKYRADRLLYKEEIQPALRFAALAGPDVMLLERARIAVINGAPSDAAIAAVPKPLQNDPGLIFNRIQKARRANKIAEAAALMLAAPRDPALLINGDEWWVERRLVARKLLDIGDAKTAYRICAEHSTASLPNEIEAEFHAGWIALRFLDDPKLAAPHFAAAAALAESPISTSRATYWQGRTAQAAGNTADAAKFYAAAATQPTTFYGQLAAAQLGHTTILLRDPAANASSPAQQHDATRAVGILLALNEHDLAVSLALSIAKDDSDPAQVAAVAQILGQSGDARATLLVGKAAAQRGIALDDAAFPTFGIPGYQPLINSADRPTVYAIARQESEFDPHSVSAAGAKGLMQLISSTARRTAEDAGIGYNETRLLNDAAFNAQIGAAHLGKLLSREGGSYILTFAAYNAGAKKVQDWIAAYGDPRKPGVDPIDWIERIPFTETRNYVQRVFENMQIYRARFGMPAAVLVGAVKPVEVAGKGT